MKIKKATGRATPTAIGIVIGVGISIIITVLASALVAYFVLTERLEETSIGYCVLAILMVSVASGALVAAKLIKRRWMQVCVGVGGSYYGLLLAITALFFGGHYQGMGVTALVVFATAVAVGLLKVKGVDRKQRVAKKYRRR